MAMELKGKLLGKRDTYIKLDTASRDLLGRPHVSGAMVRRFVKAKNLNRGERVVVLMTGPRTVTDIVRESEFKGTVNAAAQLVAQQTETYDSDLTPPPGMFPCVPEGDPRYLIPHKIADPLSAILRMLAVDTRVNMLVTGPQGTGKTTLAKVIAARLGYNFVKVECGAISEPYEWVIRREARDGTTYTVPTQFVYAMTTPKTVVLLDEINRTHSKNHNAIYSMLDESGESFNDYLATKIERAPEVLVMATANVEETNVGVFEMDSALIDRFPFQFRLHIPNQTVMSKIIQNHTNIEKTWSDALGQLSDAIKVKADAMTLSRGAGIRPLVAAAKMMLQGASFADACSHTVAMIYDYEGGIDSERTIVQNLITGIAGGLPNRAPRSI